MVRRGVTSITADGTETAIHWAAILVGMSAWFECTPLPDGYYEFAMKDDVYGHFLKRIS